MSMSKREVITVTSAADPRSIINALRDVPADAAITGVEVDELRGWETPAAPLRTVASMTFERPVAS